MSTQIILVRAASRGRDRGGGCHRSGKLRRRVRGCGAAAYVSTRLAALQNARAELQVAERNKGGHRVNALRLVNEAIGEVQAGIAAGS